MKREKFEDSVSSEHYDWDVLNKLRGLSFLLQGLGETADAGSSGYERYGYELLENISRDILKKAEPYRELIAELEHKEEQQSKTTNININVG